MTARVVSVIIRKGGSAKTTTAVNLAGALALKGKKVLLLDLDPQANATGTYQIYDTEKNIAKVLQERIKAEDAIVPVGLYDIIPGILDVGNVELQLEAIDPTNWWKLYDALKTVKDLYDYIIIDNPPSESMLVYNSLVASDGYIVPIQLEPYAVQGIGQASTVAEKSRRISPNLEFLGVLPSIVPSPVTNLAKTYLKALSDMYGDKVFDVYIPRSTEIPTAQAMKQTILEFNPEHPASVAFSKLADIIINKYER